MSQVRWPDVFLEMNIPSFGCSKACPSLFYLSGDLSWCGVCESESLGALASKRVLFLSTRTQNPDQESARRQRCARGEKTIQNISHVERVDGLFGAAIRERAAQVWARGEREAPPPRSLWRTDAENRIERATGEKSLFSSLGSARLHLLTQQPGTFIFSLVVLRPTFVPSAGNAHSTDRCWAKWPGRSGPGPTCAQTPGPRPPFRTRRSGNFCFIFSGDYVQF